MINPEQQFNVVRPDTTSEETSEKLVDLVRANQVKEELNTIVDGRPLNSLTQDELNKVLGGYRDIEKALGIIEKKIENPTFIANFEGEPIEFNLEQILNESKEQYKELNLQEWASELLETIHLSKEQIQNIKEKVEKHGFNKMRILPSIETQNKTLQTLKQETHKPIDGLPDDEQYSDKGIWLADTVESEFPDKIITKNRPEGCYIQLYKEQKEVPTDTLNKSADDARQYQKENNLQGYTLAEYLIFQREFTAKNKNHPDNDNWTWVTDSELSSSRVPRSCWSPGVRRVRVGSSDSGDHGGHLGFRSSAVLEL